jgi:hypothetical protein
LFSSSCWHLVVVWLSLAVGLYENQLVEPILSYIYIANETADSGGGGGGGG